KRRRAAPARWAGAPSGGRRRGPHVALLGADDAPRLALLLPVREPADRACGGEGRREAPAREAYGVEHHGRVELDVGLEPALRPPPRQRAGRRAPDRGAPPQ